MRKFFAFSGAIGAGKDFVSQHIGGRLISKGYHNVYAAKFANSLNIAVAGILGIDEEELQNRDLKELKRFKFGVNSSNLEYSWSSRDVQKEVGRLFRENLGKDVFINALERHYSDPYYKNAVILISDLRFSNELNWLKKNGGKMIYIHNEKAAQSQKERETVTWDCGKRVHYPPESEELQWDFYNKDEIPDYWLDNNDHENQEPFEKLLEFVVANIGKPDEK